MKQRIITLLLVAATAVGALWAQAPKRELRSTWMATVWAIDWPASKSESAAKTQMISYLDSLAEHNFNGVCFQVRGMADAMYRSSYEPWNSVLTGTRGKDPGWDPLEWVVDQCHARGLECYAWVNPYRESSTANIQNTDIDRKWEADGWLLSNGKYIVFNPGMPETRAHILKVIKEIYTNYAIDGMLFDDYFYPSGGTPENNTAGDWDLYKASGTSLSIGDWRRKNVNDFMKEIYDNIQIDRPDMRFGISPAGVAGKSAAIYGCPGVPVSAGDWQYDQIYSDPLAWLHDGAVDFISPQIYWPTTHSTAPFGPLTQWWSQVAKKFGRHFYSSHSISLLASNNTLENWQDIAKQVELHRQSQNLYSARPGEIFYSTKNIDGVGSGGAKGLGHYLMNNVYTSKSLVPVMSWKDHTPYPAPASLAMTAGKLTWTAATPARANSVIRYSVYAVPTSVAFEHAREASGDGISAQYLLGITYSPEFTLPRDRQDGHYYAVCVYDGYGYESEAALLGYDATPSAAVTLTAPADGAAVEWECTFSWTAVEGATYGIEISDERSFVNIVESRNGLTTPSVTLNIERLRGGATYYWRVASTEPGRVSTYSDVHSFVTPSRPVGNFEPGYSIVTDGATYTPSGNFVLESVWYRSAQEGFNNFSAPDKGVLNRGMVATRDYVYISGRTSTSAEADLYLQCYNASTGELERTLPLDAAGKGAYAPCNDIIRDSQGNLCISNLTLNISTTPLTLYTVNTETGALTKVASLTATGAGRVDHCGIYGDVASGNFTVYAAVASSDKVYRWFVTNGTPEKAETCTLREFSPASASATGIAPKVFPISESEFYLDGSNTQAALYSFATGRIIDAPAAGALHYVSDTSANGFDATYMGSNEVVAYSSASHEAGYRFHIVAGASKPLSQGALVATLPSAGLGNVNSTTMSAPVSIVSSDANTAMVYAYVPGNGLAAYRLTAQNLGISSASGRRGVVPVMYGRVAVYAEPQAFIRAYSLCGSLVATSTDSAEVTVPASGTYLLVTPAGAAKITAK